MGDGRGARRIGRAGVASVVVGALVTFALFSGRASWPLRTVSSK